MSLSVVARFATIGEAEIALATLEAAGICATLADDEIVTLNWLYSNAVGGIKLQVRSADREDAAQILAEVAAAPNTSPDGRMNDVQDVPVVPSISASEPTAAREAIECPSCGSGDVARVPRLKLFAFLALITCGVGAAVHERDLAVALVAASALVALLAPSFRCRSCGDRWSADQDGAETGPPLPVVGDRMESHCPRWGSLEVHRITYRRLKALPLFFALVAVVIAPIWLFLPKWKCDQCGRKFWFFAPKTLPQAPTARHQE